MATFLGLKRRGVKRFRPTDFDHRNVNDGRFPAPAMATLDSGEQGQQQVARKNQKGDQAEFVDGGESAHGGNLRQVAVISEESISSIHIPVRENQQLGGCFGQ